MSATASGVAAVGRWILREIANKTTQACRYLSACVRRNRNNG